MILGPGQGGDSPMFPIVMEAVRVPRFGGGRARTRPDAVMGDKAYSSRANRALLRGRGIKARHPRALRPNRTPQTPRFTRRATRELRRRDLQTPQHCGEILQSLQTMARHRHPLRQTRIDLSSRRRPVRHCHLATPIRRHALGRMTRSGGTGTAAVPVEATTFAAVVISGSRGGELAEGVTFHRMPAVGRLVVMHCQLPEPARNELTRPGPHRTPGARRLGEEDLCVHSVGLVAPPVGVPMTAAAVLWLVPARARCSPIHPGHIPA
jgi:hypothetical protein